MPSTITTLAILGLALLPDGAGAMVPNGKVARARLPYDGAATFDPTKIVFQIDDPGFNADGSAVAARRRVIRGGAIIRRQWSNQAQRLAIDDAGTLDVYFSLDDFVYQGSTLVSADAEAGYYGDDAAGSAAGLNNASQLGYPKVLFGWLMPQKLRATGTHFAAECVAYYRHGRNGQQVACIEFQASDAQGTPNLSPMVRVSAPALSTVQTTGHRVESWKPSIALANLTDRDNCLLDAVVKPWIGDAWTLSANEVAWPTPRPLHRLRFKNDKTGSYGGAHWAVKAGASGGAVQTTMAAALASPFPTIVAALTAAVAWNTANKTANATHSGSFGWLMETALGAGGDHNIGNTNGSAAGDCWTVIDADPGATGAVRAVCADLDATTSLLHWACDVHKDGFLKALDGGNVAGKMAAFSGTLTQLNASGLPVNYSIPICYFHGVHVASGPSPFDNYSLESGAPALVLGCTAAVGVAVYPYVAVGNDFPQGGGFAEWASADTNNPSQDGAVIANNVVLRAATPTLLGARWDYTIGLAFVQNVIERAVAASEPALQIGADGATKTIDNLVMVHNTIPGVIGDSTARANLLYSDDAGSAGVQKGGALLFNLLHEINQKSDVFAAAANHTGNWGARYWTGHRGNVVVDGDSNGASAANPSGGNWIGDYVTPGNDVAAGVVAFADNKAGVAGAGGGDYRLTGASSDAYARVPAGLAVLAFDLAELPRRTNGTGAAGAYETEVLEPIGGDAAISLDGATSAGDGDVAVSGTGGATLDGATGAGDGDVGLTPVTGDGAMTLDGASAAGSGALGLIVGSGPIIASPERIVTPQEVGSTTNVTDALPLGSSLWAAPFDPSDRAPYAIDWSDLLAEDELIDDIVSLTMSAAGASVGVQIESGGGRGPIIGVPAKLIQFWFQCADPANAAFAGTGVQVGITALVRTDAVPFKEFERTAVLTVRQQ